MGRATWKSRLTGSAARFAVGFLGLQYFQVGQCRSRVRDRRWSPETGFSQPHRNRTLASGALCKNAFLIDALQSDVMPASTGRSRFLAQVSANELPRKDLGRPVPSAVSGSRRGSQFGRTLADGCADSIYPPTQPAWNICAQLMPARWLLRSTASPTHIRTRSPSMIGRLRRFGGRLNSGPTPSSPWQKPAIPMALDCPNGRVTKPVPRTASCWMNPRELRRIRGHLVRQLSACYASAQTSPPVSLARVHPRVRGGYPVPLIQRVHPR